MLAREKLSQGQTQMKISTHLTHKKQQHIQVYDGMF